MRTESEDPELVTACSELTKLSGYFGARPKAKLFVPFELGLLFSFQRPTLQNLVRCGRPDYFGLPGRPGSAEFIEILPGVNSFFRDSFVGVSERRRPGSTRGHSRIIRENDPVLLRGFEGVRLRPPQIKFPEERVQPDGLRASQHTRPRAATQYAHRARAVQGQRF